MIRHIATVLALSVSIAASAKADLAGLAPGAGVRATFLGGNPAQAVRDPSTGEVRGVAADLVQELARRLGKPGQTSPVRDPQAVIESVGSGQADIGFVAFEPSRAGTVDFSRTYMLVRQTFLVLESSPIRTIADIDQAGRRISGTTNDSITLYLRRTLQRGTLVPLENDPAQNRRALLSGEIDAFGGNRQRLTSWVREVPGTRVLPDNLFGVPQTIILPKGRPAVLEALNRTIDELRGNGFLAAAIARSGVIGVDVAPAGSWQPSVP